MVHEIQGRVRHSSYRKSRDEARPQRSWKQGFSLLTLLLCISDSTFVTIYFLITQGEFHILQL